MTQNIFLTADTVNGVQMHNDASVLTGEVMSEELFLTRLDSLGDDECIGAYVTPDTFEKLDLHYGIRKY